MLLRHVLRHVHTTTCSCDMYLRGMLLYDVPCGARSSPVFLQTFHSSPALLAPRRLSFLSSEPLAEPENWPKESATEQTTIYVIADILRDFF